MKFLVCVSCLVLAIICLQSGVLGFPGYFDRYPEESYPRGYHERLPDPYGYGSYGSYGPHGSYGSYGSSWDMLRKKPKN